MDGMSMTMAPTATASTSSATSTSMPMSMSGSMARMDMTFYTSTTTPLYSKTWAPSSSTGYAFTCIFLIGLSVILRILYAIKNVAERQWVRKDRRRGYIVVHQDNKEGDVKAPYRDDEKQKDADLARSRAPAPLTAVAADGTSRPLDAVVIASSLCVAPWRWSTDFPRALLYAVIVGVGYLEMLAVMTMNVGYFMSIIGGAFLGELLVGRYAQHLDTHH